MYKFDHLLISTNIRTKFNHKKLRKQNDQKYQFKVADLTEEEALEVILDSRWPQQPFFRIAMQQGYATQMNVKLSHIKEIRKQALAQRKETIIEVISKYRQVAEDIKETAEMKIDISGRDTRMKTNQKRL